MRCRGQSLRWYANIPYVCGGLPLPRACIRESSRPAQAAAEKISEADKADEDVVLADGGCLVKHILTDIEERKRDKDQEVCGLTVETEFHSGRNG